MRYPRSIARPLVLRRALAIRVGPDLTYPAALLLGVVLPFEIIRPIVVTPWVALTDEKVVLLTAVVAWLALGYELWMERVSR